MNLLDSTTSELESEKPQSKKKTKSVSSSESKMNDKTKRRTHTKSEADDDTESGRSTSKKEREERRIREERELAIEYLLAVAEATELENALARRTSGTAAVSSVDRTKTRRTGTEESYQPDVTLRSEQKPSRRKKQTSEGAMKMTDAFWFDTQVRRETRNSRRQKQVSDGGMRTGESFWLTPQSQKRSSRKPKQVPEDAIRIEGQDHSGSTSRRVSEQKPSRTTKQLMLDSQRDLTVATEESGSRTEESCKPDATLRSEKKSSRRKKQVSEGAMKMSDSFWFNAPARRETKPSRRQKQVSDGGVRTGESFWLSTTPRSQKLSSRKHEQVSDQDHSGSKSTRVSEQKPSRTRKQLSDFDVSQTVERRRDSTVTTNETSSTSPSRDPQGRSRGDPVRRRDSTELDERRIEEDDGDDLHLHRPIASEAVEDYFFDDDLDDELLEETLDDFNMDHMSLSPWPEDKGGDKFGKNRTSDEEFEPVLCSAGTHRLGEPQGANALTGMMFQVVPRKSPSSVRQVHQVAKEVRPTKLRSTRSVPNISSALDVPSRMSDVALQHSLWSMQNASRSKSLLSEDRSDVDKKPTRRRLSLEIGSNPDRDAIVGQEIGKPMGADDRLASLQMDAATHGIGFNGSKETEMPQGEQRWRLRVQGIRRLLSSRPAKEPVRQPTL